MIRAKWSFFYAFLFTAYFQVIQATPPNSNWGSTGLEPFDFSTICPNLRGVPFSTIKSGATRIQQIRRNESSVLRENGQRDIYQKTISASQCGGSGAVTIRFSEDRVPDANGQILRATELFCRDHRTNQVIGLGLDVNGVYFEEVPEAIARDDEGNKDPERRLQPDRIIRSRQGCFACHDDVSYDYLIEGAEEFWEDLTPVRFLSREETSPRTIQGRLQSTSPNSPYRPGRYQATHNFTLKSGKRYTIDMTASFDTYLFLVQRSLGRNRIVARNDDFNQLNSRIVVTPTETDTYEVITTSYARRRTGNYTLRLQHQNPPTVANSGSNRRNRYPNNNHPRIINSRIINAGTRNTHNVYLQSGRRYTVRLNSSAFDAYLRVARRINGSLRVLYSNDDDRPGTLNSRITFTPSTSGTYQIIAAALYASQTGTYSLRIENAISTDRNSAAINASYPSQTRRNRTVGPITLYPTTNTSNSNRSTSRSNSCRNSRN